jgi:SagB-type dehydrogenase family enzyme
VGHSRNRARAIAAAGLAATVVATSLADAPAAVIALPGPRTQGTRSLEEVLAARRSVRSYARSPLTLAEVGQLLWASQGITDPEGRRTAPSAGALYPLEVYLAAGAVEGLAPGVYRYDPQGHHLLPTGEGDRRASLATAAGGQQWVRDGAAVVVLAAVFARTEKKYGARAERYVHLEAGHAGQNVCLEATALGLATVVVGAFDDRAVQRALGLPAAEEPLVLLPVGRRR